jgi:enoyl-[acyl-carrier protein] reductase I
VVASPNRIHALPCNVQNEIPLLFEQRLPELLGHASLDAIVHSIAYAPDMKQSTLLTTRREDFCLAHDVSAYSFLEVAQYSNTQSLTALSYLGAVRAVPHYSVMGPCKASLESLVRGLALELGSRGTRVNAVSSGPLATMSGRGITGISSIQADVECRAPLKRNVTADEVADTVRFLATQGTGITGQTIYVDGGYSIVAGPIVQS